MARDARTYRAAQRNRGRGQNAASLRLERKITGLFRASQDRMRALSPAAYRSLVNYCARELGETIP